MQADLVWLIKGFKTPFSELLPQYRSKAKYCRKVLAAKVDFCQTGRKTILQ